MVDDVKAVVHLFRPLAATLVGKQAGGQAKQRRKACAQCLSDTARYEMTDEVDKEKGKVAYIILVQRS